MELSEIINVPENKIIKTDLDLQGTQITSLPDNLSVGGSLYLEGTQITPLETNAGDKKRSLWVWNHKTKGNVMSLGCLNGSEEECINAVRTKYGEGSEYEKKIKRAFEKFNQ